MNLVSFCLIFFCASVPLFSISWSKFSRQNFVKLKQLDRWLLLLNDWDIVHCDSVMQLRAKKLSVRLSVWLSFVLTVSFKETSSLYLSLLLLFWFKNVIFFNRSVRATYQQQASDSDYIFGIICRIWCTTFQYLCRNIKKQQLS